MIGCLAYATSDHITIDNYEIEDARWFSFNEIEQILNNEHPEGITIPNDRTIANQLVTFLTRNKSKL
jgi:NAD+ diphosphatase